MRAPFDTNVYISAFLASGAARRALLLAEEGVFALQVSQPILDETTEVLARFGVTPEDIRDVVAGIDRVGQRVVPHVDLDAVPQDRDDNTILECALASRSDYIVTSDKHLLRLKRYGGADIVTPAAFLTLLRQREP